MNNALIATPATDRAYCTFRVDDRLYGIEVGSLREVSTNVSMTPVPQAPAAVRGLANLRSRILLVLDLRPLVGLSPVECTPDSRLIILKPAIAEDVGILVDRGGEILRVAGDQIETLEAQPMAGESSPGDEAIRLVVNVCKLKSELLMIIDASRFAGTVAKLMK